MKERSESTPDTDALPRIQKPILLLFSDDSTLIFARLMRDLIRSARPHHPVELCLYERENALSSRQMRQFLPEGPDRILHTEELAALFEDRTIRAIITSRLYAPLRKALKGMDSTGPEQRLRRDRPCLVAFLGGLELFPERGLRNRLMSDVVFLFPRANIARFEDMTRQSGQDMFWQRVGFGHPAALTPRVRATARAEHGDIYFFTQAISPKTRAGRAHMVEVLIAIAERHPDRNVYLKLRNLPEENRRHLHVEKYDYPSLLAGYGNVPKNLKWTACPMSEALDRAALAITCTSTAALDAISAGIPTMVYLDYVDNFLDPLNARMRGLFQHSNLVVGLERLLSLRPGLPNPAWIDDTFSARTLGHDLFAHIEAYEGRPGQTGDVLHPS